jgi:hypothetical protein
MLIAAALAEAVNSVQVEGNQARRVCSSSLSPDVKPSGGPRLVLSLLPRCPLSAG